MKRGCVAAVVVAILWPLAALAAPAQKPEGFYRPGSVIAPPTTLAPGLQLEGWSNDWQYWRDATRRRGPDSFLTSELERRLDLPPSGLTGLSQAVDLDVSYLTTHGIVYVEKYRKIWICDQASTGAHIIRFNDLEDLTDQDTITSAISNARCGAIVYVAATDKLYAQMYASGDFDILEIDPVTGAQTEPFDAIAEGDAASGATAPTIGTDGTYLYSCTATSPGKLIKLNPATGTQVGSTLTLTGFNLCHAIVHDEGYLYATGSPSGTGWLVKVDAASPTAVLDSLTLTADEGGTRMVLATPDSLWIPIETNKAGVVRVRKSDLSRVETLDFNMWGFNDPCSSSCGAWDMIYDGRFIWIAYGDAKSLVRFDPWLRQSVTYRGYDATLDEVDFSRVNALVSDGRGRLFAATYNASVNQRMMRIAEPDHPFAVQYHPPGLDRAVYSTSFPLDWDRIEVDGAQCTKTTLNIGSITVRTPAILCTDNAAGIIYFNTTVADSNFEDALIWAPHVAVQFEVFSDQSSGVLAFDVTCGCSGDGDQITANMGSAVANADVTFTTASRRRTFMAATASGVSAGQTYQSNVVIAGGSCEHGDWLFCKAVVDATNTTVSSMTGTYLTGISLEVPSTGMGDSLGIDQ